MIKKPSFTTTLIGFTIFSVAVFLVYNLLGFEQAIVSLFIILVWNIAKIKVELHKIAQRQ